MGKKSTKTNTSSTSRVIYGDTTTANPYAKARTNNSGTVAAFQPNSALESVYNFVNSNMNSLLDEYLNPSLNSTTNQAKLKSYTNTLDNTTKSNLENNIINPLSKRNMVRSSQATDLYKNLSSQNAVSLDSYINDLLSSAQNQSASMINNLLQMYLQGHDVISNISDQSLQTSKGNATRNTNSTTTQTSSDSFLDTIGKVVKLYAAIQGGGAV